LSAFKAKGTATGDPLTDWRQGLHDDLVLAVALATWMGENWVEPYTGPLVLWPPVEFAPEPATEREEMIRRALEAMDREEEQADPWR
jgi:hypothetical protein